MRACVLVASVLILAGGCVTPRPSTPAPVYELTAHDRAEIERVDLAFERGWQVPALAVDRPAVVSRYLKLASKPGRDSTSWRSYEVGMQRLLNRWSKEVDWSDSRLDWDVWNAYLQLERCPEEEWPKVSAWDLVLHYLSKNASSIAADSARAHWWVNEILDHSRSVRRAALVMYLASCIDERWAADFERIYKQAKAEGKAGWGPSYCIDVSTPAWPRVDLNQMADANLPLSFRAALDGLAGSLDYDWQGWGFDPDQLPQPYPRVYSDWLTQAYLIDQYSWLERTSHETRATPTFLKVEALRKGSVVLFSNKGTLLCWPRTRTPDAALKLAVRAGLLSDTDVPTFYARGFSKIDLTVAGP
jgi:hypothetical protein